MFLIRTAFWLALVVVLLPTDAKQQEKLYSSLSRAAYDAATFCDRNADLCRRGAEHWATFRSKLEFGARMAIDLATERFEAGPSVQPTRHPVQPTGGTLRPEDMTQPWRSRPVRSGA